MTSIETSAAKRFDLKYGYVGHLFQGRFEYSRAETEESLLVLIRYIHLNPVAAGLVHLPEEWPYSDYREHVGEGILLRGLNRGEGRLLPWSKEEYARFVNVWMENRS